MVVGLDYSRDPYVLCQYLQYQLQEPPPLRFHSRVRPRPLESPPSVSPVRDWWDGQGPLGEGVLPLFDDGEGDDKDGLVGRLGREVQTGGLDGRPLVTVAGPTLGGSGPRQGVLGEDRGAGPDGVKGGRVSKLFVRES